MKTLALICSLMVLAAGGRADAANPREVTLAFVNGALLARAVWLQGPQSSSESTLRLEWKNAADQTPTEPPGRQKVALWMPDMGHGSSPTRIQQTLDHGQPVVGSYDVTRIFFTMGGAWDVNVTLKFADGSEETHSFPVEIGGGHGGHH